MDVKEQIKIAVEKITNDGEVSGSDTGVLRVCCH